jgi:light-harvesting complex I chlorophyll a/b binding protein 1
MTSVVHRHKMFLAIICLSLLVIHNTESMKFAVVSILVGSAIAFAPAPTDRVSTAVRDTLNGWTPDESKFAWGLPGAIAPFEDGFDPLGLATGTPLGTMKQWREAEVNHGRVAMLAAVGMLVTEEPLEFHPLFEAFNKDIGPAIRHLDEVDAVSPFFLAFLTIGIGSVEWNRALVGFA